MGITSVVVTPPRNESLLGIDITDTNFTYPPVSAILNWLSLYNKE